MKSHHEARHERHAKANALIRRTGHHAFKHGGGVHDDARQDHDAIAAAVHKHERHDHKGEPLTKLRHGGDVEGERARHHMGKRARGGRTGKHGTKVNVIVAPQQSHPVAPPSAMPPPAAARPPAARPAVTPVPVPVPPGGVPMGAAPGMVRPPVAGPTRMMRSGGGIKPPRLNAGAGGGEGRREKAMDYGGKAR